MRRTLSALTLLLSMAALTGSANAATIAVDAQQPWAANGVAVKKGQTIKVTATGRINYCDGQPQCDATPDGSVSGESHCGGPGPCGALIGRIGEAGAPFLVGSEFKAKAGAAGTFQLGINDFDDDPDGIFDNNSGSFSAKVTVEGKGTEPKPPPSRLVGTVVEIRQPGGKRPNAQVFRDGKWEPLRPGDDLREFARVRTVGETVMAIELDLGGRVYLRPGTEVRVGERSVRPTDGDAPKEPWKMSKGGVWAKCGRMKESLEIQTTGGIMGIVDTSKRPPRQGGEAVGTITSLGSPDSLLVTPRGGIAAPAQPGQVLGFGDLLNPLPGVAATLALSRPSSVAADARLIEIEPRGGAAPIVSIDRPDAALTVSING